MKTNNKPPAGLSAEAQRYWRELHEEFIITSPDDRLVAESVVKNLDLRNQADEEIRKYGVSYVDRYGVRQSSAACRTRRDADYALRAAIKQLRANDKPPKVGRPAIGH